MIQRIQSVFLLVAAIACIFMFFLPLAGFYNELEGNYKLYLYTVKYLDPDPKLTFSSYFTLPLVFFVVISIILSIAAIFSYRNRTLQKRLCAFNILSIIVMLMVLFFFYITTLRTMTNAEPEYHLAGMAMPLLSLAMLVLASRAIRKDEALVKSADRLR
jgi:glucan phosphoethanolaminetransferase (alkaline phosphatase superfamily)